MVSVANKPQADDQFIVRFRCDFKCVERERQNKNTTKWFCRSENKLKPFCLSWKFHNIFFPPVGRWMLQCSCGIDIRLVRMHAIKPNSTRIMLKLKDLVSFSAMKMRSGINYNIPMAWHYHARIRYDFNVLKIKNSNRMHCKTILDFEIQRFFWPFKYIYLQSGSNLKQNSARSTNFNRISK